MMTTNSVCQLLAFVIVIGMIVLIVFDNTEPCSNKTLVYFFEKKFMRTSLLLGAEIFLNRLLASISDHGYLTNYYLRLHNFLSNADKCLLRRERKKRPSA